MRCICATIAGQRASNSRTSACALAAKMNEFQSPPRAINARAVATFGFSMNSATARAEGAVPFRHDVAELRIGLLGRQPEQDDVFPMFIELLHGVTQARGEYFLVADVVVGGEDQ
jgi:hypothetical protein